MTAKVITLGIQKGGCSKSTTTCITAKLLADDGYKVLVVDMDSQGNSTEILTGVTANKTIGKSVLESIYDRNGKEKIIKVTESVHLLPGNNTLASLPHYFYTGETWDGRKIAKPKSKDRPKLLEKVLDGLKEDYDYILVDTPPALSMETTNSLHCSDYVVVMSESSKLCLSAIPNFLDTVEGARIGAKSDIEVLGILINLNDGRRSDMREISEFMGHKYANMVFSTIMNRSAQVGRVSLLGVFDNKEIEVAKEEHIGHPEKDKLAQYREFYKELMERVREKEVQLQVPR